MEVEQVLKEVKPKLKKIITKIDLDIAAKTASLTMEMLAKYKATEVFRLFRIRPKC